MKNKSSGNSTINYHGVLCELCGAILVSFSRHDFRKCNCDNETYIDGGQKDYTTIGAKDPTKVHSVLVTWVLNEEQTVS